MTADEPGDPKPLDWSRPVEAVGHPGEPVRFLAADLADDVYPVAVYFARANRVARYMRDGTAAETTIFPPLRNKPPERVLRDLLVRALPYVMTCSADDASDLGDGVAPLVADITRAIEAAP